MAALRRWMTVPILLTCLSAIAPAAHAQARFDLAGPKIDVRVTRGNVTLPIAAVPNLQPGDQLWLHPAFPPSQSVHYLLIAVFLRGTTNPPPDDWFTPIETWNKRVRDEGVFITVPAEAQQAILFLAPQTGGDFGTLRSAVKKHPGNFVRASQDLTEAGFEQARIETYLSEIKKVPPGDPAALLDHSNLLARTLNLKPNPDCFKRPVDQQYNCLTQTGSQMLLDDGHGQSVVAALSNGPSSDFINAASYTGLAGGGNYSAYVGALVDLVRLTSTLHTAQYQYIPAIAFPETDESRATTTGETLNLHLNAPPSFSNPKSVIVIGLPTVQKSVLPPLRPAEPDHISCLLDPHMVLPIEGAPLVFSTAYAHHLVLHLNLPAPDKPDAKLDLPIIADAYQGGLTIDSNPSTRKQLPVDLNGPDPITNLAQPDAKPETKPETKPVAKVETPQASGAPITGTIEGYWGFDRYTGPTLPLENVPGQGWRIATSSDTPAVLIAGQPNHLQLAATGTACVQSISLEPADAKVEWKLTPPPPPLKTPVSAETPSSAAPVIPPVRPIEVTLNLQKAATPGSIRLAIQQFGQKEPDQLGTKSFAEPAKIEALHLHAGDRTVVLKGDSLNQVKDVTFKDLTWTPQPLDPTPQTAPSSEASSASTLTLTLPKDAKPPTLKPNEKINAEVHLEDGRTLQTSTFVLPARPEISILTRRVNLPTPSPIQLASLEDLPLGAQLTFFLKSKDKFPRNEQIEIASKDSADSTAPSDPPLEVKLSIAAGTLILQDNHTILATFDPLKTFGPSTFGQFHLRAVSADGTPGEWLPLATIVRLPILTDLHCPTGPAAKDQSCLLSGSALYLIQSISTDPDFTDQTPVPEGFVDTTLAIPHPVAEINATPRPTPRSAPAATFYIRLRDDPTPADPVTLAIEPQPAAPKAKPALAPIPPPPPTNPPPPTTLTPPTSTQPT
jgi:hypothetical protein